MIQANIYKTDVSKIDMLKEQCPDLDLVFDAHMSHAAGEA